VPTPPATYYGVLPYRGAPSQANLEVQAISGTTVCNLPTAAAGANHLTYSVPVNAAQPSGTTQVVFQVQILPADQGAPAGCGINGQPVTIIIGGKLIGYAIWDNSRPITFRNTFLPVVFGPPPPASAPASGAGTTGTASPASGTTGEQWIGQQVP
jgi:hypothetical protein